MQYCESRSIISSSLERSDRVKADGTSLEFLTKPYATRISTKHHAAVARNLHLLKDTCQMHCKSGRQLSYRYRELKSEFLFREVDGNGFLTGFSTEV